MNIRSGNPVIVETGSFRYHQILDELSNNKALTQRELSNRLGIALGLVNSYVKNLISKGYITVKTIPPKRYSYYLTSKGFTEKTRLTYHLFQDYTRIYREAKNNLRKLFRDLEKAGVKKVMFAGADEVAEIAFLMIQETTLELLCIIDDSKAGEKFLGMTIRQIKDCRDIQFDRIIVTSYIRRKEITDALTERGVGKKNIGTIFPKVR